MTSTQSAAAGDVVRLNVNLAPDVAATLRRLAAPLGHGGITETIRRGIAVLAFMDERTRKGGRLVLIEPDGKGGERLREIVMIP